MATTETELDEMRRDAERYRYVRTLSPRAFREVWEMARYGSRTFDQCVDARLAARKGKHNGSSKGSEGPTETL